MGFLTSREARERLKAAGLPSSRTTLEKLIDAGEIPAARSGPYPNSGYRIPEDGLAEYIAQRSAPAARDEVRT